MPKSSSVLFTFQPISFRTRHFLSIPTSLPILLFVAQRRSSTSLLRNCNLSLLRGQYKPSLIHGSSNNRLYISQFLISQLASQLVMCLLPSAFTRRRKKEDERMEENSKASTKIRSTPIGGIFVYTLTPSSCSPMANCSNRLKTWFGRISSFDTSICLLKHVRSQLTCNLYSILQEPLPLSASLPAKLNDIRLDCGYGSEAYRLIRQIGSVGLLETR